MNPWLTLAALLLLPIAVCLEEASIWFGRQISEGQEMDEEAEAEAEEVKAMSQALLLSRFLVAGSFSILVWLAVQSESPGVRAALLLWGLVWILIAAGVSGLRWQSPWSLAGRAFYRALSGPGFVLSRILWVWGTAWSRAENLHEWARRRHLEIDWLLGQGEEKEELKMLATLQEFGESTVEEVMVRREEIMGIPSTMPVREILGVVETERYTRYPVYDHSLDTVTGVLHVFDLLSADPEAPAGSLARKPLFTNSHQRVGNLLRELQRTYNQMAVVVDEYGGTAGVVTVEDLLEELVGEIEDEDDELESPVRLLEPGVYWVLGTMRIEDLNEVLELDLPEGEYDTVAGLVLERLERVPVPGERVVENGASLEVLAAEPHRIHALRVAVYT